MSSTFVLRILNNFQKAFKRDLKEKLPPVLLKGFDFYNNLPVLVSNVRDQHYLRQHSIHYIGILNLKTTLFINAEYFALKRSNEVISCLKS